MENFPQMHAITLQHPWPFFIVYGGKRIENRGWMPPPGLIGERIAIHGGKEPVGSALVRTVNLAREVAGEKRPN